MALDEIGEPGFCLVGKEFSGGDGEDLYRKENISVSGVSYESIAQAARPHD